MYTTLYHNVYLPLCIDVYGRHVLSLNHFFMYQCSFIPTQSVLSIFVHEYTTTITAYTYIVTRPCTTTMHSPTTHRPSYSPLLYTATMTNYTYIVTRPCTTALCSTQQPHPPSRCSTPLLHLLDAPQPRPRVGLPLGEPNLLCQRRRLLILLPRLASPPFHLKELAQVVRRHCAPNVALFVALASWNRRCVCKCFCGPLSRLIDQNSTSRCARYWEVGRSRG
jgi:hypothetical protein